MEKVSIRIAGKDYNLRLTLGFWKAINRKQGDFTDISENQEDMLNAIKWSIYYGEPLETRTWTCIKELPFKDTDLLEVDDNLEEKIQEAYFLTLSKKMLEKYKDIEKRTEDYRNQKVEELLDNKKK